MTELQQALFNRLKLRNGGDALFTQHDWKGFALPVIAESRRRTLEEVREMVESAMPLRGISTTFQSWTTDGSEDTMKVCVVLLSVLSRLSELEQKK